MKLDLHFKQILYLSLFLLIGLSSCRSPQELVYFRDSNGYEKLSNIPKPMPIYRIHKKDNLYISIISPNTDLNKIYNPVQAGTNANENSHYDNVAGQYINGYEVDDNGFIQLPIIGKINVENKTIAESEKEIETHAIDYLKAVTVKVKLLNFRVTVLGEVKLPGVYYNYNDRFSVTDAIGMANRNTDFADLTNVMILRPSPTGSEVFSLNLNSKESLSSEAYFLQPNDKIFIRPARNKNSQLQISTAALILSTVTSIFLILNYIKN